MLSRQMAATESTAERNATAIAVFGKGGIALVPIMVAMGEKITDNMHRTGELTGATKEARQASMDWQNNMAQFSLKMQFLGNVALTNLHYVVGAFEGIGAVIQTVVETVGAAIVIPVKQLGGLATVLNDIVHGNFAQAVTDARGMSTDFKGAWKNTFDDIAHAWEKTASHFRAQPELPKLADFSTRKDPKDGDDGGDTKKPRGARSLAFQRDEEALNELKLDHEVSLAEEIRFWEARLATAKKGSDEYRQILARLAPLVQRQEKQKAPPAIATEAPDESGMVADFEQRGKEEIKANEELQRQLLQQFHEAREEEIRLSHERFTDLEHDSQFEVQMGRLTASQRIALLKKAADDEYAIERSKVQALKAVDAGNLAAFQRDLNRETELTRQHNRQIVLLNQQAALQTEQSWRVQLEKISEQFNSNVARWAVTGKGFTQSMAQSFGQMTQNFIANILRMTEQYLLSLLVQKSARQKDIFGIAGHAAAKAYDAVVGIPFVGPVLAPVAAAVAFAGVEAFQSFNEGGVVQGGNGFHIPILAKQGERVLTPQQTQNIDRLANGVPGGAGATNHVRATFNQHFHEAKASSAGESRKAIQQLYRRNKLSFG
jgi:hypothetical protein